MPNRLFRSIRALAVGLVVCAWCGSSVVGQTRATFPAVVYLVDFQGMTENAITTITGCCTDATKAAALPIGAIGCAVGTSCEVLRFVLQPKNRYQILMKYPADPDKHPQVLYEGPLAPGGPAEHSRQVMNVLRIMISCHERDYHGVAGHPRAPDAICMMCPIPFTAPTTESKR